MRLPGLSNIPKLCQGAGILKIVIGKYQPEQYRQKYVRLSSLTQTAQGPRNQVSQVRLERLTYNFVAKPTTRHVLIKC
jgi:hypothetical protein